MTNQRHRMTVEKLREGLVEHDKGVLKHGKHTPQSREFCALEFVSVMHGEEMHDRPTHTPDLRPLNDGLWSSDSARTEALLPVLAALWDWRDWNLRRKIRFAELLVIKTVQRVISKLPGLSVHVAGQCLAVIDLKSAYVAADAAHTASADYAVDATRAASVATSAASVARTARTADDADAASADAARAANAAAYAADFADAVLLCSCSIMIESAAETEGL